MTGKINGRDLALIGLVAAIYVVLTVTPPLNAISYGPLQFRLSEVLNFLPFYHRRYILAVTLGVFLSNLFSFAPQVDMIVGTLQTLLSLLIGLWLFGRYKDQYFFGWFNRAFFYFAIFDAVFGMAIIAGELWLYFKAPFLVTWLWVGLGELLVLMVGAVLIDQLSRRANLRK